MSALKKNILIAFIFVGFTGYNNGYGQTTEAVDLLFQEAFFEGLKQKGIQNYSKAVYHFEKCYELDSASVAVAFELSKSFLHLKRYEESSYFIDRALQLAPDNVFLKWHKVVVLRSVMDIEAAIRELELLSKDYPEFSDEMVLLYIQNQDYKSAGELIKAIENRGQSTRKLIALKKVLESKIILEKQELVQEGKGKTRTLDEIRSAFYKSLDFKNLDELLGTLEAKAMYLVLVKESSFGLELYPAQAKLYLYNAKALFHLEKYNAAIDVLNEGLSYIVSQNEQLITFYELLSSCYTKLNNTERANEFKQKAAALRNKE